MPPKLSMMLRCRKVINDFPEMFTMGVLISIAWPIAYMSLKKHERERPFTYRVYYTVWRDDDPRAAQMLRKMEKYNWKPEEKPKHREWWRFF